VPPLLDEMLPSTALFGTFVFTNEQDLAKFEIVRIKNVIGEQRRSYISFFSIELSYT
jgi:hypothetical protein